MSPMSNDADEKRNGYYTLPYGLNITSGIGGLISSGYLMYTALDIEEMYGFFLFLLGFALLIHGIILVVIGGLEVYSKLPQGTGIKKRLSKEQRIAEKLNESYVVESKLETALKGIPEDSVHYTNLNARLNEVKSLQSELQVEMVYDKFNKLDKEASKLVRST